MQDVALMIINRGARLMDISDSKDGPTTVLIDALKNKLPKVAEAILLKINPQNQDLEKHHKMKGILDVNMEEEEERKKQICGFLKVRFNYAMDLAFQNNFKECIKLILSYGGEIYRGENRNVLPITPEDYKSFLDDQIRMDSKNPECIIFDYSNLCRNDSKKELKLISDLTNLSPGHKNLIKHPLIEALLMMEWKRLAPWWMYYMLLKLAFMTIFIFLGVGTFGLQQFNCNLVALSSDGWITFMEMGSKYCMVFWSIFAVMEIWQLGYSIRKRSRWQMCMLYILHFLRREGGGGPVGRS